MSERIIGLAARGDGITESGRFVAGAAPGDLIAADGSLIPGPHRQTPLCRHFGTCGGCQLQHVDDAAFAQFLTDRIASALAAQGLHDVTILEPHLSPPGARRRVALKAQRLGKRIIIGFSEAKSHKLVDLGECSVMRPELWSLIAPLRAMLTSVLADRKSADIRMTVADQGVDVAISGVRVEGLAATEALADFAQAQRLARLSLDEGFGLEARWEPQPVTITLGDVPVPLPADAFLQATEDGEAVLVASVREAVGDAAIVADLFSGLGTFALAIHGKVFAAEGARDAALALQAAANRAVKPVSVDHRDLFRRPLTAAELARCQVVILDPPRAGAQAQAAELAASAVPRIVYVSCNPATFARDAAVLVVGGYTLQSVKPVGQFRWSTHVELVGVFSR